MKRDGKEHFRKILSRHRMWMIGDSLDEFLGFVGGFDAASDPPILDGIREWLLANYSQCNGPFGWSVLVGQILPENLQGTEAVDRAIAIVVRFLDETDARDGDRTPSIATP